MWHMLILSLTAVLHDIYIYIYIYFFLKKKGDKRNLGLCSLKIFKASGPLSCCSVIEILTECLMMMSR
jgi:hypothetical protein